MTKSRGGSRPGAGRPKSKDKRIPLCVQIRPWLDRDLREESERTGESLSSIAESAIEEYLDDGAFQRKLEEIEALGNESRKNRG